MPPQKKIKKWRAANEVMVRVCGYGVRICTRLKTLSSEALQQIEDIQYADEFILAGPGVSKRAPHAKKYLAIGVKASYGGRE